MINQRYRGQTTRIVSNNGTFFPQLLLDPKDYRSWISFYRAMSNTQDMLPQLQQVIINIQQTHKYNKLVGLYSW